MKTIDYTEDEYHKSRHPEYLNSLELSKAWSVYTYLEYFGEIEGKEIFEFGGALGYNLLELKKHNRVTMVEPSPIGRKTAEQSGIKSYLDIAEMNQDGKKTFDIVFCRHVLEHVHDPLSILKELKSLLKPDGKLILVLPFEKQAKPIENEIDFHLYCWTPRTAINLLHEAGFGEVDWRYNYATGKRMFYTIYKKAGGKFYRQCMKLTGRLMNAKEMVFISDAPSK